MTFSGKFFPSKVHEFLHALFNCVFFWLKCSCSALLHSMCTLRYFVLVFLRNKVQTSQKKYRGMVYYLIEKHMQKFRHFWKKKKFTQKSHIRPSCTKPFNYLSQAGKTSWINKEAPPDGQTRLGKSFSQSSQFGCYMVFNGTVVYSLIKLNSRAHIIIIKFAWTAVN